MARIISVSFACLALLLFLVSCASTEEQVAQGNWLDQVEQQALLEGVSPQTVHAALDHFVPNPRVVELDKKQPEKTITFETYRHNTISAARVKKGADLMRLYAPQLSAIETRTGVPPQIVIALWAVESSFGQNMGNFETVNSLATLAYEGRRASFFRSELIAALHILDREHMAPTSLRGSWAGAMGQCQFMPSTYLNYAVDGDGDGRIDIWNDTSDVLASIANYLAAEGWQRGLGWGQETNNPPLDLPPTALMQPDGVQGASFIVSDNIRALMRWNHSTYFALSVGLLSDQIAQQAQ